MSSFVQARRFLFDLVKTVGSFTLFISGGTFVLLLLSTLIGYLPYSDRPGPGWYGFQGLKWQEVWFFFSWAATFLAPFCFLWAVPLFALGKGLRLLRTPKWTIAIVGALFSGLISLVGAAAAGWYIAIAAPVLYAVGLLGLVYGAVLLPRFVGEPPEVRTGGHWLASALLIGVFLGFIAYTVLRFTL